MRGSLLKRGETWSYVLYLGRGPDGKKQQKWVGGFRTRREAEAALTEALERVRTGTWADPGRQTVGEYLEDWLTAVRPSLRSSTATSYEHTLRKWVIPRIGHLRLGALSSAKLSALYGELLRSGRHDGKGGLSARSVAYTHRIVTHALKDAVAWGLLARNPAAHVDPPRVARPEIQVWTQNEVQRFLVSVADDRLYALSTVLLAMLYVASGRASYVVLGLGLLIVGGALADRVFSHVHTRVISWLDPWSNRETIGYQLVQALYAFASGGVFGAGLDMGSPRYIPAVHTDFVIAAIGEELGLAGTLAVIGLFVLLVQRGFVIALNARSGFSALLASGLTSVLALQAIIILAGTLELIPLTGITLPFVSYGGSSVVANFVLIGLLLRISHEHANA